MKNLLKFIKVFAVNIAIAIAIVVLLSIVTLYVLNKYTQHGEAISVPDFEGMTLEDVEKTCAEYKLRYEIIDSVYSKSADRGAVVDQSPKKDFKVKENRTIFITINAIFAEKVSMPKVTEVSLRQATALLETYGLRPGKLTYKPDMATNYVLEQRYKGEEIKPGTMVDKWSEIDMIVGKQSHEKGIIPNVIGFTYNEADNLLSTNGFNIGLTEYGDGDYTQEDSLKARVWKQLPRHNKKNEYSLGTMVDLWLTTDSVETATVDSTTVENH